MVGKRLTSMRCIAMLPCYSCSVTLCIEFGFMNENYTSLETAVVTRKCIKNQKKTSVVKVTGYD